MLAAIEAALPGSAVDPDASVLGGGAATGGVGGAGSGATSSDPEAGTADDGCGARGGGAVGFDERGGGSAAVGFDDADVGFGVAAAVATAGTGVAAAVATAGTGVATAVATAGAGVAAAVATAGAAASGGASAGGAAARAGAAAGGAAPTSDADTSTSGDGDAARDGDDAAGEVDADDGDALADGDGDAARDGDDAAGEVDADDGDTLADGDGDGDGGGAVGGDVGVDVVAVAFGGIDTTGFFGVAGGEAAAALGFVAFSVFSFDAVVAEDTAPVEAAAGRAGTPSAGVFSSSGDVGDVPARDHPGSLGDRVDAGGEVGGRGGDEGCVGAGLAVLASVVVRATVFALEVVLATGVTGNAVAGVRTVCRTSSSSFVSDATGVC